MLKTLTFVLIDNDPVNNLINQKMIRIVYPDSKINIFLDPIKGFEFIQANILDSSANKTVLFLDINMPEISGWDFMKKIEQTKSIAIKNLTIYMLSSSVEPMDLKKSKRNMHVKGFLEKPMTIKFLKSLNELNL